MLWGLMKLNLTSRNAFIADLLAVAGKKESRNDKRTLSWDTCTNLTCFVNHSPQKMHYFLDYFTFSHFLAASCKTKLIKFCTKFQVKLVSFLVPKCSNLLLHIKISYISSTILKESAHSRVSHSRGSTPSM